MTVLEPISLIAGFLGPFISPDWFIAEQIPGSSLEPQSANAQMVAYQLGNIYLLLAMVGIGVLYSTTEAKVARNYVVALWLADIGHVAVTAYVTPYEKLVDLSNWNAMAWGNIGATAFLFSIRMAYLLGLFGPDRVPLAAAKKLQ